ncbi:MAG TPA: alkaline phosphatase family protein, partial [Stellaceae bacterium]|nr:alkaline phosphatase family protein [Stellaceae bacterium]
GPGRRPLADAEGLAVAKGDTGDTAVTERFCDEVLRQRAPALALLWLSEPDYTGHHTALGSPAHRAAITSADGNVRRVTETVARLDPAGDDILFVVGSDHGMESVDETIDLDAVLVEGGLKHAPASSEVVVAPNGTAAVLYFSKPESALVGEIARFLDAEPWVGRVFTGGGLGEIGLPTASPARIAITLKADGRVNPHGVAGHSHIVRDSAESKDITGFGQHGGLGVNEQCPFLFVHGGGFTAGPYRQRSSLVDIAPTVLRHLGVAATDLDGRPLPLHPTTS